MSALILQRILSFDDSPSSFTPALLQALSAGPVRATFFANGDAIQNDFPMAQEIVRAGHLLENHGWNHQHFSELSFADCQRSIMDTEGQIQRVYKSLGFTRPHKVFRFPYGNQGFPQDRFTRTWGWLTPQYRALQKFLKTQGFEGPQQSRRLRWPYSHYDRKADWLWTFDTKDWDWLEESSSARTVLASLEKQLTKRSQGQEVILMHDQTHACEARLLFLHEFLNCHKDQVVPMFQE